MTAPIVNLEDLEFSRDLRHGDSGKSGAMGGRQPDKPQATFPATFVKDRVSVDYWHGE